jgi:inosine-uridine nucleoside N-ribohydrolase
MSYDGVHLSWIYDCMMFFCRDMYKMEGIFLHDAAAFTAVVHPEYFEWHTGKVVAVPDGPAKGLTIMDRRT